MNHKIQISIFTVALLLMALVAFFVIKPYIGILFFSAIFGVLFYPLSRKIKKLVRSEAVAALITTLILLILVLGPLVFFGVKIFQEAQQAYAYFSGNSLNNLLQNSFNNLTYRFPALSNVSFNLNSYLKSGLDLVLKNTTFIFSSAIAIIFSFILFLFSFFYMIKDGEKFKKSFSTYSPLSDEYDNEIISKIKSAIQSVIKGSLLVAIIQGAVMGIGFWIFNIGSPVLWGSVTAIAALVPGVGTALVWLPTAIILFFMHSNVQAIQILLWGALAASLIDNFVGPYLVGRGTNVPSVLIIFSVLGGISLFGFVGFLLGPVVMAILFALLEIYPKLVEELNK